MWQRESLYSISSDTNTVTSSEAPSTSIFDISNRNRDSDPNHARPGPSAASPDEDAVGEPRPSIYRNSSVPNVDQENSLKDRIRYLTSSTLHRNSSGSMSMPFVASPNFHPNPNRQQVYTPRRSRSRATSLANSVDHRLSIIDEDNPSPPQQPDPLPPRTARASHRPFHRKFGIGEPPKYEGEVSPPGYTFWDVTGPRGEKFEDIRNNPYIARRGGWKRLCLIFWILLVIIIALSVGLGVGLAKNKNNSTSAPAPATTSASSSTNGAFPAGSYTFSVYLTQTKQSCTSNPASFTCNPGTLYNSSVSGSKAQFQWKINPTSSSSQNGDMNRNFTISSSANPFAVDFQNVGLQLLDKGMDTERYNFQTTVQKIVFPQQSFSVKCYYNSTLLSGNLYTKKPKDQVSTSSSRLLKARAEGEGDQETLGGEGTPAYRTDDGLYRRQSSSPAYSEWPYASDISQSVGGGQGVPDCYQYDANKPDEVGTRVTDGYQTRGAGEFCSCVWGNWGLS